MKEFKIVPTKILGKPKLAIVIGWSIKAEPDAKIGAWCGSGGIDDAFFICDDQEQAIGWMMNINANGVSVWPGVSVDERIVQYLSGTTPSTRMYYLSEHP